jgi:ATP-dependent RNA helicase DDX56/DBP9
VTQKIHSFSTNHNVLARSETGSGKTAAYILPILHSILHRKNSERNRATTALILVPTRELAQQVSKAVSTFSACCSKDVRTVNLTQKIPEAVQRTLLAESPDVVVATPARAAQNLQNSALSVDKLAHLVIDEADLVLSYGYDDDLQAIAKAVPKGVQTFLMSATLTTEVTTLKGLFCRDPVILDFQESSNDGGGVSQYVVQYV